MADIHTGVDYVRHGLGVALLPNHILEDTDGTSTLKVIGADLRWPLGLARPAARPVPPPGR